MADPIPRNSRADENAEYRRVEQIRRGNNRPLFGQQFGGGLRARDDQPAQPLPRAPHHQQQGRAAPPPAAPRNFGAAVRAPNPPPRPGAVRVPQAEPLPWFGRMGRAIRDQLSQAAHAIQPRLIVLRPTMAPVWLLVGLGVLVVVMARGIGDGSVADDTAVNPPLSAAMVISPPMIPAQIPPTDCAVELVDATLYRDMQTEQAGRALVAALTINTEGCNGRFIRSAMWVFQAEDVPLRAPEANPVYRSPIDQLTAQTLLRVEADSGTVTQGLALPHAQFPLAVGAPQWLTVKIQVWREGSPAEAGSMLTRQVYFTRAE